MLFVRLSVPMLRHTLLPGSWVPDGDCSSGLPSGKDGRQRQNYLAGAGLRQLAKIARLVPEVCVEAAFLLHCLEFLPGFLRYVFA